MVAVVACLVACLLAWWVLMEAWVFRSGLGRRNLLAFGSALALAGGVHGARAEAPQAADSPDVPPPAASAQPAPLPRAASAGRVKIQLFGDSLAQGLFLTANPLLRRREELRLVNGTRHATGLTRSDEHDWVATIRQSLTREPAQVVILWIGANDFRPFVDRAARARYQFGTQAFLDAYRNSVATIGAAARDTGAVLGWIGLPNMRDGQFAAAAQRLNEVMQQGTEATGGLFIPTWAATSDDAGRFRHSVSTGDRLERRLRADDGVHFSDLGYRLMARLAFDALAAHRPELSSALHSAVDAVAV